MANVLHALLFNASFYQMTLCLIFFPTTAAQEALRIKEGRPLARMLQTGSHNGLGKNPLRRVFFRPAFRVCCLGAVATLLLHAVEHQPGRFFQPDPKRGLLCNWPWLWQIVGLGAALLPTLSWAGMSCQGPDCPGMLTMLAFFLGAFVLANILGALWMIGRKIKLLWRRWRAPNGREACEPPATDDACGH